MKISIELHYCMRIRCKCAPRVLPFRWTHVFRVPRPRAAVYTHDMFILYYIIRVRVCLFNISQKSFQFFMFYFLRFMCIALVSHRLHLNRTIKTFIDTELEVENQCIFFLLLRVTTWPEKYFFGISDILDNSKRNTTSWIKCHFNSIFQKVFFVFIF